PFAPPGRPGPSRGRASRSRRHPIRGRLSYGSVMIDTTIDTITTAASRATALSLDDLSRLDCAACLEAYCGARTPRVADLDGDLVGRMLAVPRSGPLAAPLRSF